jgi:hypothetical protein
MGVGNAFPHCTGGSAFSSWEVVSTIKVIIWNKESLMKFEMCLWEKGHIYMQVFQLFTDLIALPPDAICIKYYDF